MLLHFFRYEVQGHDLLEAHHLEQNYDESSSVPRPEKSGLGVVIIAQKE